MRLGSAPAGTMLRSGCRTSPQTPSSPRCCRPTWSEPSERGLAAIRSSASPAAAVAAFVFREQRRLQHAVERRTGDHENGDHQAQAQRLRELLPQSRGHQRRPFNWNHRRSLAVPVLGRYSTFAPLRACRAGHPAGPLANRDVTACCRLSRMSDPYRVSIRADIYAILMLHRFRPAGADHARPFGRGRMRALRSGCAIRWPAAALRPHVDVRSQRRYGMQPGGPRVTGAVPASVATRRLRRSRTRSVGGPGGAALRARRRRIDRREL